MYNFRNNLIIGFHGCDKSIQASLLNTPNKIQISNKPYDWLGHGIYFWENNYDRALEWAKDKAKRNEIKEAAVIGAVLSLDYCLDLTDSSSINILATYYRLMKREYKQIGKEMPKNKDIIKDKNKNLLLRNLDCAVIEFMHQAILEETKQNVLSKGYAELKNFDSARGLFIEGDPAFPGAGIRKKSHLQICVRNNNCIKGFFLPRKKISFP